MLHLFKVNIARQFAVGQAVNAYVNHYSAFFHHICRNKIRSANSSNNDVSLKALLFQMS